MLKRTVVIELWLHLFTVPYEITVLFSCIYRIICREKVCLKQLKNNGSKNSLNKMNILHISELYLNILQTNWNKLNKTCSILKHGQQLQRLC